MRADCGIAELQLPAQQDAIPPELLQAYATGLYPLPRLRLEAAHCPPAHGTFNWILCPQDQDGLPAHEFQACCYTDGSRIHNQHPDTLRLGWAFAAINSDGMVIAAASGVPPSYITDVPGAEAWAILQAAAHALPGSCFRSDCLPCVSAIASGRTVACTARRPLARVFNRVFDLFELRDFDGKDVAWMPAHTAAKDVGVLRLSDGTLLSVTDRNANALADSQAKLAAAQYAAPADVVLALGKFTEQAKAALRLLGVVTWTATHFGPSGSRDSEASRAKASAARPATRASYTGAGARVAAPRAGRPSSGLNLQKRVSRWILQAREAAGPLGHTTANGPHASHRLFRSGDVVWCARCGAYSSARGRGLARPCTGPVPVAAVGGRAQQLRQLIKGRHPKLHHRLPPAVPFLAESRLPDPGSAPQMRTDDIPLLSRSAAGRRQLRVRRREFLRRSGASPGDGSAGIVAEPATPSAANERRAKLVQQLLEAATDPSGLRPAKRLKTSPSAPPGGTSQPTGTTAPVAPAEAAPAQALTAVTPAGCAPATPVTTTAGQAIPSCKAASVGAANKRHSSLTALPQPPGGRGGAASSQSTTSDEAATLAPAIPASAAAGAALATALRPQNRPGRHSQTAASRPGSVLAAARRAASLPGRGRPALRRGTVAPTPPAAPAPSASLAAAQRQEAVSARSAPPGTAGDASALRRVADAVAGKRGRSHPALRRSMRAPLALGLSDPNAPAASSGRADSLWGRDLGEPTWPDSDDCEAGAKRARVATGVRRAWQPPQLLRGGRKRAHEPTATGAASSPRSPSGARGTRRRTGR